MNLSDLANVPSFRVYRSFARGCSTGFELDDFLEKLRDRDPFFKRMAKGRLSVDGISVSSSVFLTGDDAGLLKFGDDALNGSLGDADLDSDISEASFGISQEADKDVGVVCQERPTVHKFERIIIMRYHFRVIIFL